MQAEVWGYRGEAGEQRKPVCRKKWEERDRAAMTVYST